MRLIFIFFLCTIVFHTYAQAYDGIDSVRNIRWEDYTSTFYLSADGSDSVPSDFNRIEYNLKKPDAVVIMVCGDTIPMSTTRYTIPQKFWYKGKISTYDGNKMQKRKTNVNLPDSVTVTLLNE